jgi:sulfur-carrier protein
MKESETAMAKVVFTPNIQRHVICPDTEAAGLTVCEVLEKIFAANPQARGYVLDDQAALRKHITIFIDGRVIHDRIRLSDAVTENSKIYVLQALSGG